MTPQQKIKAIIAFMAPEIRDAFLLSISGIVDNVVIAEIADAIEAGDFNKVYVLLNITDPVFRPMQNALENVYEQFADVKVSEFPAKIKTPFGTMVFRFNMRDPVAEKFLRDQSSDLVTAITDDVRTVIRNTMTDGMQQGRNPRSVALDIVGRIDQTTGKRIGGVVGITGQQEGWSRSVRAKLQTGDETYFKLALRDARFDSTVRKAFESGKPLNADTIDKLVYRYRDNALKYRGDQIAITEIGFSQNASDYEAVRQVVAQGMVKPGAVSREWDTVGDTHVRHMHQLLNGQIVGMNEPFVAADGSQMMYPGDASLGAPASERIGCRCRAKTKVDWGYGL